MRLSAINNSVVVNNETHFSTTNSSTLQAAEKSLPPLTQQLSDKPVAQLNPALLLARQSFRSSQLRAKLDARLAINKLPTAAPATIIRLANVNERDSAGRTPLMAAAVQADIAKIKSLIAAGADVNATDQFGQTALALALFGNFQPQPEAVRILIRAGANVNARDLGGRTPLFRAINSVQLMRQLIAARANLNAQTTEGNTALMACAFNGQIEGAKLLIRVGANLNIRNDQGKTALTIAEESGNSRIAALLRAAGAGK